MRGVIEWTGSFKGTRVYEVEVIEFSKERVIFEDPWVRSKGTTRVVMLPTKTGMFHSHAQGSTTPIDWCCYIGHMINNATLVGSWRREDKVHGGVGKFTLRIRDRD